MKLFELLNLTTVSVGATHPPHPNPPPQGGRGPEGWKFACVRLPPPFWGEGRGGGLRTWPDQNPPEYIMTLVC
jgi:hypothetical protein